MTNETTWDLALRALVADAWEKRGTDELLPACRQIVTAHELWPLVEVTREIDRARDSQSRGVQRRLADWAALEPA